MTRRLVTARRRAINRDHCPVPYPKLVNAVFKPRGRMV